MEASRREAHNSGQGPLTTVARPVAEPLRAALHSLAFTCQLPGQTCHADRWQTRHDYLRYPIRKESNGVEEEKDNKRNDVMYVL